MLKHAGENIAKLGFATSHLYVQMNKAEHGAWAGCVTGQRLAAPIFFEDLSGLLLQVDAVLDEDNFPRAYQRKRTFTTRIAPKPAPPAETEKSGDYTHTFVLHITSRQNACWQGIIDWQNGQPRQSFASELELLRLLF